MTGSPALEQVAKLPDLWRYLAAPRKRLVLMLSTMRSGSTLLKALLGAAPDVSHLPEVRFHHLNLNKYAFYNRFCRLADEPIIVLKHPVWFTDPIHRFPIPPLARIRVLCLVRDCYPALASVKAMPGEAIPTDEVLVRYWVDTVERILVKHDRLGERSRLVRYEDIVQDPVPVTRTLFQFIGSKMPDGVATYAPPDGDAWTWGHDDGGDKIRTREVLGDDASPQDPALLEIIRDNQAVVALRARLGYGGAS